MFVFIFLIFLAALGLIAVLELSLVTVSGELFLLSCEEAPLLQWLSLVEHSWASVGAAQAAECRLSSFDFQGLEHSGFRSCGPQA